MQILFLELKNLKKRSYLIFYLYIWHNNKIKKKSKFRCDAVLNVCFTCRSYAIQGVCVKLLRKGCLVGRSISRWCIFPKNVKWNPDSHKLHKHQFAGLLNLGYIEKSEKLGMLPRISTEKDERTG